MKGEEATKEPEEERPGRQQEKRLVSPLGRV